MKNVSFQSAFISKTILSSGTNDSGLNADLLSRGGYLLQDSAGVFSLLPLGLRVLSKIEGIVREEMARLGAQEVLLPALHTRKSWEATGRWDSMDVLYKLEGRGGKEFCLGPTHEEVVTPLAARFIKSYRDLPRSVFQIQTKFRDELRPRAGLLRGREFRMKDMYSFHGDTDSLETYYREVMEAYNRIFSRMGFVMSSRTRAKESVVLTMASGGDFTRSSHEYQLLVESGEDTIFVTPDGNIAFNKEVMSDHDMIRSVYEGDIADLQEMRAVEIGNIFKLGARFSEAIGMTVANESGSSVYPVMGCYGIGTTRIMASLVEVFNDTHGIIWPQAVAPYDAHLLLLGDIGSQTEIVSKVAEQIPLDWEMLVDDRKEARAGEKFADADLYGCPVRITIGKRFVSDQLVGVKKRNSEVTLEVTLNDLKQHLATIYADN